MWRSVQSIESTMPQRRAIFCIWVVRQALNQGRDFNINLQVKVGYLVPLSERYQVGIEPMVTYYLLSVGTAEYMVDINPISVGLNLAFRYNTLGK